MNTRIFITIILFLLLPVKAQEIEIGGLLLDSTISRQGHEFYYKFSQLWQDSPNSQGINVQIMEQVIPRSGSRLMVKMNDKIVYVTYMGRRQQPIKERVETAMFMLIEAMAQAQFGQDNPDLANDGW